jgi:VCBS repeat-containing protein
MARTPVDGAVPALREGGIMLRTNLSPRRLLAALVVLAGVALSAPPGASATGFVNPAPITINDGSEDCLPEQPSLAPARATPYPSQIIVSGLTGTVTDVNATLVGFTHPFPDDVAVLLVAPGGEHTILMADVGGPDDPIVGGPGNDDVTPIDLTFDGDSAPSLPDSGPLASGTFTPTVGTAALACAAPTSFPLDAPAGPYEPSLSNFNGTSPNGIWSLYVIDDSFEDVGSIRGGWIVDITATTPNAAPVANPDAYTHYGSDTPRVVSAQDGVLANDTDADNDTLTATKVTNPSHGSVTLDSAGSLSYQPDEDFVGQDSFTYKANDGIADSDPATVAITVGAGCRGKQATITGTIAANKLTGTAGDDVIAGLGGGDTILAGGGSDTLCGGSGNDSINANSGNDHADGGSGNDTVRGDAGNDTLLGGAGLDSLLGDTGNDSLSGGTGSPDTCKGDTGTDTADSSCERISGVP